MPAKKKKEYKGSLVLDPFFYEVSIILTTDFNATITDLDLGLDFHNKAGLSIGFGDSHLLVFDIQCLDNGVIAHESAHCIFDALESAGQDPVKGEETFTYLLQHVVNFIHAICKKNKVVVR